MTQRDLNRAVAKATGESVSDIAHMGFSEVPMPAPAPAPGFAPGSGSNLGDRCDPAILDWDALDELLASGDFDGEPTLRLVG